MWSNRLRPILLRCSGCISRNTHHSSASPDVPLSSQASQRTSPLRKKQVVLEKVNTNEQGIKRIKIYPPPSLMESQSVILPGPERIRASGATSYPEDYVLSPDKDTFTACDALMKGVNKSTSGRCMGRRNPLGTGKYEWISYTQVVERLHYIGSGLVNFGISPSQESKVGICTKTRPEFLLTLLACSHYSMVLVPLYECFGADIINQIIHQAEMEVVFCENSKIAADIIESADKYPSLKHLILIDDETESLNHSSIKISTLKNLEECGEKNRIEPKKPYPDDLLCICYTSGTTGVPKGVMVTHGSALASIGALDTVLGDAIPKSGSLMCYLPCAHIYEILNEIFCLYHGGQLGFYSGKTETLLSDIAEFQPDVLPLVPKLMNLIYSGVKKKIGPNLFRRQLFRLSLGQKEKKLKKGIVAKTAIWDKLILSKIQRVLGGRVQMIFNSSAPASKEVMKFFRCSMGSLVFEVYGLSEVGAAAMTLLAEHESGFVGPPLPCSHIKLVSVPELSYFAENDVGEICLRGANVFSGYFKNPEATKEAIDNDGWYHTGDIGKWLPNGALSIIDRKKHIFKLVQGEYIIPDKSENVYIQSPLISQVYIDGDSNEEFIIGIVVPDPNSFIKWAKENGFENITSDYEALCQNKEVKLALMAHLLELGKKRKLNSLHQIGNIYICTVPFTSENNLLTPTMKLKRSASRKHFETVIKSLYQEGNLRKIHNL